jgi:hypothetical protein
LYRHNAWEKNKGPRLKSAGHITIAELMITVATK